MSKKAKKESTSPVHVVGAMMSVNPATSAAWLDIMNESARFVSERLQQDIETQQALLQCKSPADLLKVQADFYQTALTQYSEEAAKLFDMMTKAATNTVDDAKSSHARDYDDVPV